MNLIFCLSIIDFKLIIDILSIKNSMIERNVNIYILLFHHIYNNIVNNVQIINPIRE